MFLDSTSRSSHPKLFSKKVALKISAIFTGKHLRWSLFLINLQGLRHRCFPVNIVKFLRTAYLKNTSGGSFWTSLLDPKKKQSFQEITQLWRRLNVLSQVILHLICQYDAQNVHHSKNIRELSWMSHSVSFCSFVYDGALERNAYWFHV